MTPQVHMTEFKCGNLIMNTGSMMSKAIHLCLQPNLSHNIQFHTTAEKLSKMKKFTDYLELSFSWVIRSTIISKILIMLFSS